MKRSYQVSQVDADPVSLEVILGTVGIAYSVAYQTKSGGQKTILAESNTQSGKIKKRSIGTSGILRNSYVVIQSVITLGTATSSDWETITKNIFGAYKLFGGFSGDITFNYDSDDVTVSGDGRVVVITKPIEIK